MEKEISTNSFYIKYKCDTYKYESLTKNKIILEIYRCHLYKKLKMKMKKIWKNSFKNIDAKNSINIKDDHVSLNLLYDFSYIIILNHKFNSDFDPLFDNYSPFNKNKLEEYFDKKCIPTITNEVIVSAINILSEISNIYIKYYKKLKKKILLFNNIKYEISYKTLSKNIIINFNILLNNNENNNNNNKENNINKKNNWIEKIKYFNRLKISTHIFNHLIKLYNTSVFKNYTSNEILDDKVLEYIYMIFARYYSISSGNNQASLLPSFKKILKEKLNIKVELFGSPINTSSTNFGSIYYDIDSVFGSLGNYFNMKIEKGYYEINPVFDKCLIDKIFIKCLNELLNAEKNKDALLFCIILPYSYFKFGNIINNIKKFLKYSILLKANEFPYLRYDRYFSKTKVSGIVTTRLLIFSTSYISTFVKYNIENFSEIINKWIKKDGINKNNDVKNIDGNNIDVKNNDVKNIDGNNIDVKKNDVKKSIDVKTKKNDDNKKSIDVKTKKNDDVKKSIDVKTKKNDDNKKSIDVKTKKNNSFV